MGKTFFLPSRCLFLFFFALIGIGACDGRHPQHLDVLRVNVAGSSNLPLNQEIIIYLSAPADPATVSSETVQITEQNRYPNPVKGLFQVSGKRILFYPALPGKPDLSDSAFQPGATYRLFLACKRKGIRSLRGEGLRFPYETCFSMSSQVSPPFFKDPVPGFPRVFGTVPKTRVPPPEERVSPGTLEDPPAIEVFFSEPLSPASVSLKNIRIFFTEQNYKTPIPGSLSLFQGYFQARVVFSPFFPLPEDQEIHLQVSSFVTDLVGNPLEFYAGSFLTADSVPLDAEWREAFEDLAWMDPVFTSADWCGGSPGFLVGTFGPGGDGRDGSFFPSGEFLLDTTERPEGFFYSEVFVPEDGIVRVAGSYPLRLHSSRNCVILGKILMAGEKGGDSENDSPGGDPGFEGPGGGMGGWGGCPSEEDRDSDESYTTGGSGWGMGEGDPPFNGGGVGGEDFYSGIPGGGGGGGYSTDGEKGGGDLGGRGGMTFGDSVLKPTPELLKGGSGGGGGACDQDPVGSEDDGGAGGGGGGGALFLAASGSFVLEGMIDIRGGDGGNCGGNGGGGGGGSGGALLVRAQSITISRGSIHAFGGNGGVSFGGGENGGKGGDGRIRLEDLDGEILLEDEDIRPPLNPGKNTGIYPAIGPGGSMAQTLLIHTGVLNPRYSFDGSDPLTGRVSGESGDVEMPGGIPPGCEIFVFFEGGRPLPGSFLKPDPATLTGFVTDIRSLDGCTFIRIRILLYLPEDFTLFSERPAIDTIRIRYEYF